MQEFTRDIMESSVLQDGTVIRYDLANFLELTVDDLT